MKVRYWIPLLALVASGQQPEGTVKFEAAANLVVVNVQARDRSGKLLNNLRPEDFELLEDGKPQKISVFEFQSVELDEPVEPLTAPAQPGAAEPSVRRREITPSSPGQVRYRDRRLIALYFDFGSMAPDEQIRAQEGAIKFVTHNMAPSDLVALMGFSTSLRVLQDFTGDRELLLEILRGLRIGETSELAGEAATDEETGEDTGAAFTADETEFNIFNTDRRLGALESAAKMLGALPEKKALVYFSSGVGRTGMENESQLRATMNAALQGNVAFYPVDARGLVAEAPGGDSKRGSAKGSAMFSGRAQQQRQERFSNQQETLYTLAAETGGKALVDNNDLSAGVVQAQTDFSSYYILGYYSTNGSLDGRFRRIRVRLPANTSARLDYRSGYFAPKDFRGYTAAERERHLEEALALGDPITDLAMALEVNYFRLGRERYFVPVAIKIPASEIEMARRRDGVSTVLDFIGQVRDDRGRLVGTVRDAVRVNISGADSTQLALRNLQYDTAFTLPPGSYTLKVLARENETGKMGTFQAGFEVPDLLKESNYLRLSSVVLSNQREPLSSAVGAADRNRKLYRSHPLVTEDRKLIPSITRVFRKDQQLHVYFEAYDAALAPLRQSPMVAATVSFFRGNVKAFETRPTLVAALTPARPQSAVFQMTIPLENLEPGRYTCQVNVVDRLGQKFAFRRAEIVLLPQKAGGPADTALRYAAPGR